MKALLCTLLAAAPALAAAHELWIEPVAGGFAVRQGHPGEALVPLDPARVAAVRCRAASGPSSRPAATAAGAELRVAAACAAVSVAIDHGYFSLTPDGEVNRPRTAVAQSVRSWESRAFAKWVDARGPAAAEPLGDELELVPVTPLASLREGDKVTVRVLLRGAPVEGAVVAYGHRPLGETDRAGEARIRVRGAALHCLGATVRRPQAKPEAETLVLEASLCFGGRP